TRAISELRLVIDFQSANGAMRSLTLDIVDYPGEWLLDLPLLGKSYEHWSAETLAHLRRMKPPAPGTPDLAGPYLASIAPVDPLAPADEGMAMETARLFTDFLVDTRKAHDTLNLVAPGRF